MRRAPKSLYTLFKYILRASSFRRTGRSDKQPESGNPSIPSDRGLNSSTPPGACSSYHYRRPEPFGLLAARRLLAPIRRAKVARGDADAGTCM